MECHLKDLAIHYEEHGRGRPIIMLHGWTLDHLAMVDPMEPLFQGREGWRRIYLDLPGHGRTPGADWVTDQDRMLEVVEAFIEAVIPGQRYVVAGVSAGAYLAQGLAHRQAAQIDGLLLVVPLMIAADDERDVPPPIVLVQDEDLASRLEPELAEGFRTCVVQNRAVWELFHGYPRPEGQGGNFEFLQSIRGNPTRYGFSFEVDPLPEPFPAPALILCGRQDSSVGYRDAWRVLESYPRATYAVLDRAGHILWCQQVPLFQALVGEWLDRVDEYVAAPRAGSSIPGKARGK